MSSNTVLKGRAISLRKEGKSYNDIRKILGIASKGTISYWFKDLKLDEKSNALLQKNIALAHKRGLFTANKNRDARIKLENKAALTCGMNCIKSISEKDLILIGAALYWGEGTKSERQTSAPLVFSNSDPLMIEVYMKFVREILRTPEEKIRAGIHLYPSTSIEKARSFWSIITKLPKDRFYIITQVSRASQSKRPFNTLPHGTAVIRINSRIQFHKVKGMIRGIVEKIK